MEFLKQIASDIIVHYGYFGIFAMTSIEQFIFPIPADGFVAMGTSMGLPFWHVMGAVLIAALFGSYIGYFLGRFLGMPIIIWLFGKRNLHKGENFIAKYGVWGIIAAGLTPIPFKIMTWSAGMFKMPLGKFTIGVVFGRMPRYIATGYLAKRIIETKFYASIEMSAIILGILQGVTEFLPISSSGHLVAIEHFLNLPKNTELFDIFLHGGSLLAILIFFWRDWVEVLRGLWHMLIHKKFSKDTLASKLIMGTLPAIFAGLLFGAVINDNLKIIPFVAIAFITTAFFFLFAEWKSKKSNNEDVNLKKSFIIGCAQAIALLPGISRAGSTIATGMLLGLKREAAAKFSFMLGGIAILAANTYALLSVHNGTEMPPIIFTLIGAGTSFVISLVSISWLLKFLKKHTLRPFSFYLIILGVVLLSFFI